MPQKFSVGDSLGDFVITKVSDIDEIQTTLIELEHLPSGAQVIQLANDDQENLFNLSFKTWPEKSNGVAHVLEHVILCGSENFPVRDPFFSMNRRSLNTFMNALTGADFTCYPAASQVEGDFYNLMKVYLDAVFKPKLTKESFLQEGHRLEFLEPDDPNSPLLFKGIVFNEMKGAMATGDARLSEALMQGLLPDLTYGVNSGGDPKEIPNLTYEDLKHFHERFYHPSRCLFFFYGNIPLEKNLQFIEEQTLKGVKKLPPLPLLPKQPRFKKGVEKTLGYPISDEDEGEDKALFGMSWLTCNILEQVELMALCILDVILMGTDAAPLKMALLKSNLCKQTDSMLDTEMSEIPFTLVCKGCKGEDAQKIEDVIREAIEKLVQEGIPSHLIDGAIHQIEMARTEITGNSSPYGLHLYFRSALLKQHGGNPEDGLRVHTLFNQLREKVKDPKYLTGLIEKHLLQNPHYVRIAMLPEKSLALEEMKEEQEHLAKICTSLKDPDVKEILKQAKNLQKEAAAEDLSVLPKVTLKDVAPRGQEFPLKEEKCGPFKLYYHPCFTNDLVYADLVFDLPAISEADLPYLRLFSLILPQVGCGGRDYRQNLEYQLEHTGGIGVALDLGIQVDNPGKTHPSLSIRGKALNRKMDKLFPLFRDLVISADFQDISRIEEVLKQHYLGLESSIQNSSLRYAVNLAACGLSVPSTIGNAWYGLDYFYALKKIVETFEKKPETLISKLQELQQLCLGLKGSCLVLSCDQKTVDKLKQEKFYGLTEIPSKIFSPWNGEYPVKKTESQGRITASPVAFTALLFESVCYTHPDAAALSIASEIMENKVLHKRIREQGGAYGTGAVNGVLSGQFYFYAYRDPHLKTSIEAFHESIHVLAKGEFKDSDIEEAQLGLFQDLDSPTPPGSRAMTTFGRLRGNRTPEARQLFRERLLKLSKKEIVEAVKEHLIPGIENGVLVAFAGKEFLEKENEQLNKPLPLYPI